MEPFDRSVLVEKHPWHRYPSSLYRAGLTRPPVSDFYPEFVGWPWWQYRLTPVRRVSLWRLCKGVAAVFLLGG